MSPSHAPRVTVAGDVRAAWSDTRDGDCSRGAPDGDRALARFAGTVTGHPDAGRHLCRVHQVHGATVVVGADARRPGPPPSGDALVTAEAADVLTVVTADCASIALGSPEGAFAAVHAGWRGLVAGVVEEAAAALRALGATSVRGALGPAIHAECYEFGAADLDVVAGRLGDGVRGETTAGHPALDLPAAVAAALGRAGVEPVPGVDACTACGGPYYSHRARRDAGRQALVVWSAAA